MPLYLEIIILALTGSGGAAGILILFKRVRRFLRGAAFGRGFHDIQETYETLSKLLAQLRCHRVVVFKAENEGGIPRPGHPLTSSVIYEVFGYPMRGSSEGWQKQECDGPYVELLAQLTVAKALTVCRGDVTEGSHLADHYEAHGVLRSEIFALGVQDGSAFLYLSCVFANERDVPTELTAKDRTVLRSAVTKLKTLFETV
ncbi:MAG: hypothetical protein JKY94_17595 [Rhodobacteraceae bacterium]|nr:hypothetical protein [Paracoccaceae bacterium]